MENPKATIVAMFPKEELEVQLTTMLSTMLTQMKKRNVDKASKSVETLGIPHLGYWSELRKMGRKKGQIEVCR
jgi:hypothetical protein